MFRFVLNRSITAALVLLVAVTGCTAGSSPGTSGSAPASGTAAAAPPPEPSQLCGSAALKSPFSYDGAAGPYASGKAGLPTYGTAGSDFPHATAGVILPPGPVTICPTS